MPCRCFEKSKWFLARFMELTRCFKIWGLFRVFGFNV